MFIAYRRTGGVLALLMLAAVALAATVFTVALGVIVLAVGVAMAALALAARAVLPARWRRTVPPATPWPHETIEGTVVDRPAVPNSLQPRR